jgi:hypothetical protein
MVDANSFNEDISEVAPTPMQLSADAKAVFRDYYNKVADEFGKGKRYESIPDVAAKAEEMATRITCLLYLYRISGRGIFHIR